MIFETIVTSLNADGSAHVAPFGIREVDGLVLIAPFRPSTSLDNLLRAKTAVLNLTDDVRMFAGSLIGKREWPVRAAGKIQGWVVQGVLAHRELELVKVVEDTVRPQLWFRVVHEQMHAPFRGFNRAQAAVVELAVLVSRLHMLPAEKIDTEIRYLSIAMEKTAGEREKEAWDWLMEAITNFRAEQNGENLA
ncbi:MAG TPA: DUF447 domain-containing protein [Methylophilaceae bacterium]